MGASGLGALLVKEGLLSEQDRATIGRTSGQSSWAFAKGVIALGLLDEDELAAFLAERTQHRVAAKDVFSESRPEALATLDVHMLERLEVLPIDVTTDTVTVAMADPLDKSTLRQLEFFTGRKVKPIIASFSQIYEGLRKINPEFEPTRSPLESFLDHHAAAAARRQKVGEMEITPVRPTPRARPKKVASGASAKKIPPPQTGESEDSFDDVDLDGGLDEDFDMDAKGGDLDIDGLDALDGDGLDEEAVGGGSTFGASSRAAAVNLDDLEAGDELGLDGMDLDPDRATNATAQPQIDADLDELASFSEPKRAARPLESADDPFAEASQALDDLADDGTSASDSLADDIGLGGDELLGDMAADDSADADEFAANDDDLLGATSEDLRVSSVSPASEPLDAFDLGESADDVLGGPASTGFETPEGPSESFEMDDLTELTPSSGRASKNSIENDLDRSAMRKPPAEALPGDIDLDEDLMSGVAGDDDIESIGDDLLGGLDDEPTPNSGATSRDAKEGADMLDRDEGATLSSERAPKPRANALDDMLLEDEESDGLAGLSPSESEEKLGPGADDTLTGDDLAASAMASDLISKRVSQASSGLEPGRHDGHVAAINQAMMRLSMASSPERVAELTRTALAPVLPFAIVYLSDGTKWEARFGWETGDDDRSTPLAGELSRYLDRPIAEALSKLPAGERSSVTPSGHLASWLDPVREAHGFKASGPGGRALALVCVCEARYRHHDGFAATTIELLKILLGKI